MSRGSGGDRPFAIIIPARYQSTRFPGKPLCPLRGAEGEPAPLIERTWRAASATPGAAQVLVATDDDRIMAAVDRFGGAAVLTDAAARNGTERCAQAAKALDPSIEVIINWQGDSPLTPPSFAAALVDAMHADSASAFATPVVRCDPLLRERLVDDQRAGRVGGTTVAIAAGGSALYFSKSVIPHIPPGRSEPGLPMFLHIGIYAYRRDALERYARWRPGILEELEGLEQLRILENGEAIQTVEVDPDGAILWELNNPEDIPVIEEALARRGLQ